MVKARGMLDLKIIIIIVTYLSFILSYQAGVSRSELCMMSQSQQCDEYNEVHALIMIVC